MLEDSRGRCSTILLDSRALPFIAVLLCYHVAVLLWWSLVLKSQEDACGSNSAQASLSQITFNLEQSDCDLMSTNKIVAIDAVAAGQSLRALHGCAYEMPLRV